MSTRFNNGVDEIIATMLWRNRFVGLSDPTPWASYYRGQGVAPTSVWPVFEGGEPEEPDNCATVYETTPEDDGVKIQVTGEIPRRYGFTIRVRAGSTAGRLGKKIAREKAERICHDLLQGGCTDQTVTLNFLDETDQGFIKTYLIQSIPWASVVPVGRETPNSHRWIVNVNGVAVILAYPIQG